jgi:DNA processing protein
MSPWQESRGLLALMGLPGVGATRALAIAQGRLELEDFDLEGALPKLLEEASSRIAEAEAAGISILGFFDDSFPESLRAIPQPPAILYVKGGIEWPTSALAVVGTRKPTNFGKSAATELTRAAAARGITIVSGLALGVDGLAHEAALAEGTRTVAVLGSGLDQVSPRQHQELADRIIETGGSLVSEQPPGTDPGRHTLVSRNRLQSGLAGSLLVAQTGVSGGTMHTVRFAAEQGRPVFCPVPHRRSIESAGLDVLLNEPTQNLPALLPAWKSRESLAEQLGHQPIARPVTTETIQEWLEEIATLSAGRQLPHYEQLGFDV